MDVHLEYDVQFICGFEFDNEYGRIFSEKYVKVDGEVINNILRYVSS